MSQKQHCYSIKLLTVAVFITLGWTGCSRGEVRANNYLRIKTKYNNIYEQDIKARFFDARMTSTLSVAEGPHTAVVQPSHPSREGVQECHQDVREKNCWR